VLCRCERVRKQASVGNGLLSAGSHTYTIKQEFKMNSDEPKNQIRQLSRIQRRVIGVLMEKGFTTPEQYPLTLKAATTGCNQKSNRDPVTSYSEDQVMQALDELREQHLVAEVFTDGGRAARYRHYMRHCFDFSEAQFAIIAELLLRGRQQLGELRTRASRMIRIESQEALRDELSGLQENGFLQSNGPLERRGIEVDHTFYLASENQQLGTMPAVETAATTNVAVAAAADNSETIQQIQQLTDTIREQADLISRMDTALQAMDERLQRLERDLGV
jgi:uncharacterized protein YceH (UPF0502 family)